MTLRPNEEEMEEIQDVLLALFLADGGIPIKGRIMLVKQAFLIAKQITPDLASTMKFFPYLYGPYSNPLAELINSLIDRGYIRSYNEDRSHFYELTEEGKRFAEKRVSALSEDVRDKISQLKKTTQDLGLSSVLKMVYRQYPEYAVYSRGSEVYGAS